MKIFFKIISYFILILIIDLIGSNIFLKKTEFWEYKKLLNHYWRISSDVFHHGLMPNIDVIEPFSVIKSHAADMEPSNSPLA